MAPSDRASRPLSGQELDRLEVFCEEENEFGWEPMPFDMLQGFLCGVASAAEEVSAEDWLPWVFGIDPWPDPRPEALAWFDLAQRYYRMQITALEGREDAELMLYEPPPKKQSGDPANKFTFWCVGFLDGLIVESEPLEVVGDPDEVDELLFPLRVLAEALDEHERRQFDSKQWAKLNEESANEMWPAVLATYRYGNALRGRPATVRRETPKTGRNDPCPCGSGKKFKNCCGKAAN